MQTASKKVINGWAMYDWANSVYSLVMTATIFPAYYEAVTGDGNDESLNDKVSFLGGTFVNTSLYDYVLAIAFLLVAFTSPILSSIADFRGNKKLFLRFFCTMGSVACCSLYFFTGSNLLVGLGGILISCIGFWGSLVFYNSYLPEIAAPEDRDDISAKGYVRGYIGSMTLQIICFVFVLMPDKFGISKGEASRLSFVLVGTWWFGFGQWAIGRLPATTHTNTAVSSNHGLLFNGYKELLVVWQQVKKLPVLKNYLGAFFCYNMGVQTIMLAATMYGKSELNIPTTNLIVSILIIQLVAIAGAYLIAKLSDKVGNFKALIFTVSIWVGISIFAYCVPRNGIYLFYTLATIVGFVMGGIQSLSRSTYSKLMPETKDTTSFFSFYDVTEKLSIVFGMFSFGIINELTGSQRNSVLTLGTFFILGIVLLMRIVKQQSKQHS